MTRIGYRPGQAFVTVLLCSAAALMAGCSDDGSSDTGTTMTNNGTAAATSNTTTDTSTTATTGGTTGATSEGCAGDTDCSVGEICLDTLCQPGCRDDTACAQNELCLDLTCVSVGTGCRDDSDCGDGFYCEPSTSRCTEDDGGCRNDPNEPNDNIAEATPIERMTQLDERYLCDMDNDYYSVTASPGDTIAIELTFQHEDGDLAFELLDERGQPLVRIDTTDDNESLFYTAQSEATYFIRVFHADGSPTGFNTYDLTVQVGMDIETCRDTFEPNNTSEQAARLRTGLYDLSLCPNDEDWFSLDLASGARVELSLTDSSTRVEITFYDTDGTTIIGHSADDTDTQMLEASVTFAGIYYIRIASEEVPEEGLDYDLTVVVDSAAVDPACTDRFEPNENGMGAVSIEPGRYDNLTICSSDDDYYRIPLGVQDRLTATILFEHMFA
ncbi:MAG: PPC domain-containing protein, partial [Myxococcota bacterium]